MDNDTALQQRADDLINELSAIAEGRYLSPGLHNIPHTEIDKMLKSTRSIMDELHDIKPIDNDVFLGSIDYMDMTKSVDPDIIEDLVATLRKHFGKI